MNKLYNNGKLKFDKCCRYVDVICLFWECVYLHN